MRFKLDRDGQERRYAFFVITEVDPRIGHYVVGQIIVCEVGLDGNEIPIEVGTWGKPGKVNAQSRQFDLLPQAINYSYAVVDGRIDEDGNEIQIRQRKRHDRGGKKFRKARHKA